jgi:2-oxoglutarate dehydrogenase complex dehydrogenase (E1) component-like enzyme
MPSVPPATAAPERSDTGEGTSTSLTLEEIEKHLMGIYVDKIGVEFMHSPVKSERL